MADRAMSELIYEITEEMEEERQRRLEEKRLRQEEIENEMPETLAHAKWLKANVAQDTNVMILDANQKGAMYVVGTLGQKVSENATFNVTPTFVVSRTSID